MCTEYSWRDQTWSRSQLSRVNIKMRYSSSSLSSSHIQDPQSVTPGTRQSMAISATWLGISSFQLPLKAHHRNSGLDCIDWSEKWEFHPNLNSHFITAIWFKAVDALIHLPSHCPSHPHLEKQLDSVITQKAQSTFVFQEILELEILTLIWSASHYFKRPNCRRSQPDEDNRSAVCNLQKG